MSIITTQQKIAREATHESVASIPTTVRCRSCRDVARENVRERLSEDEVIVQYSCPSCRWQMTRHFYEDTQK